MQHVPTLRTQRYKGPPYKFSHYGVMAFGVFLLLDLGNKWDNIKMGFKEMYIP